MASRLAPLTNSAQAGYFGGAEDYPALNRGAGFRLQFSVVVTSENHNNNHRAGYSIIALGDDAQGIEIGFWTDTIWAQEDNKAGGSLFTHAEEASFDTTTLKTYAVDILSDTYQISSEGSPILSGRVRNYEDFAGFPDVYETPNFIFLGDDTTSAGALIELQNVVVATNTCADFQAVPPTVTAIQSGDNLDLSWSAEFGNYRYEVHQSSEPNFMPNAGTLLTSTTLTSTSTTVPITNSYFLIQAQNCASSATQSIGVGKFSFAIQN